MQFFYLQHEFISLEMLLLTAFFALYAFGVVMIICELGQRLADAFEQINDEINKFDWYLFPPQVQRLLPIIMIATQQEVELECFGSISGTRETFKRVSCAMCALISSLQLSICSTAHS